MTIETEVTYYIIQFLEPQEIEFLTQETVIVFQSEGAQGPPGPPGDAGEGEAIDLINAHVADINNPHSVTKAQVGLGNVDNTSDTNKPVSTAQQTALNSKADSSALTAHTSDTNNPHSVTKVQVGLGSVDNTSDVNKPISSAQQTALNLKADSSSLSSHTSNTSNPHSVTKAQVGLGNVDNTSDVNKPVSSVQQAALDLKADLVGGKVPSGQLPSFVDDVVEAANFAALPGTGEAGKIYITLNDNLTYRWSGSAYVEISASLALGETSSTAYRGDRGKTAFDHTSLTNNPHSVTKSQVGLGNVDNTSDANKPISTATQTALDGKQPIDGDLTAIAALATATPGVIATDGAGWIFKAYSALKTALSLVKGDVGLGNVDNTSDANKPVSTAQQTALNLKADSSTLTAHTGNTSNPHSVTKAQVGLGNVDNTSDANKPVSTAQQTALNGKSDTGHTHASANSTTAGFVSLSDQDMGAGKKKFSMNNASKAALEVEQLANNIAAPLIHFRGIMGVTVETDNIAGPEFGGAMLQCGWARCYVNDETQAGEVSVAGLYVGIFTEDCFTGDTLVNIPGGTKRIDEIKVSDQVLSCDPETQETVVNEVAIVMKHPDRKGYMLINQSLKVSQHHKVWANDAWAKVSELKIGDYLRNSNYEPVYIFEIDEILDPHCVTYNLKMKSEGVPTYFAGNLLVHNKCPFFYYFDKDKKYPWKCQGTFLYMLDSKEKEDVHRLKLKDHSNKYFMRELEPETSYINELTLIAITDAGEIRLEPMKKWTGFYSVMKRGAIVPIEFEPLPPGVKELYLESRGYYVAD